MEHSGFPSDETLAAFIDGRLDDVTRRRVVEHMTTCDECYAVYLAATEVQKGTGVELPRRRTVRPWHIAATLSLATAALLVVVLYTPMRKYMVPESAGVESLVSATRHLQYRETEGRLSGGFAYKPLQDIKRAGAKEAKRDPEKWELFSVASKVAKAVTSDASPENLHALGVSHLLLGNWDDAVTTLKSASRQRPTNAEMLNDLAVACLARGTYAARPADYVDASDAAKRAWELEKTPEIAWTRAVALEHLHLPDAREAWQDYLALDAKSPWRDEANRHVHDLATPSDAQLWREKEPQLESAALAGDAAEVARIAADFPQQVAAFAEEELLVRWAMNDDDAALRGAEMLANEVASRGYGWVKARCAAIRAASPVDGIRKGVLDFDRGRTLLAARKLAEADAAFGEAGAAAAIAPLASLQRAVCAFNQNDYDSTNRHLDAAALALPPDSEVLIARISWLRGLTQFETGHPHEALRSYESALGLVHEAGHLDWEAALNSLVAQNYQFLGDADRAWRHRAAALELATRNGRPQRLQYVLMEATIAAVLYERRRGLGDILTRRLMQAADDLKESSAIADAHIWRARYLSNGRADAVNELRSARVAAIAISDSDSRDRAVANLDMAEGELLAGRDPQTAVARLTDALRFLHESGNHLLRAQAFAARARAFEAAKEPVRAAKDREQGIAEVEAQRADISDEQLRTAFLAVAGGLYRDAVDLAVTSGDYVRAFDLAERSRATTAGVAPLMGIERLRQVLPNGVALVEYTALPRRTVAWIVTRAGMTATILPAEGEAISATAVRLVAERNDQRAFDVAADELYGQLIAPLRPQLAGVKTIVFVPDPTWTRFPFGALVDRQSGRRLLDDAEVAMAQSASRLVIALAAAHRPRGPEQMLVCADPEAADVPRLAQARREGDAIGRTFPGAVVMSGSEASRDDFMNKARFATFIHFAGHARNDARNGDYSALLFSSNGAASGELYAWEIRKLALRRTRLVVLAACGTDAISDAFLAAGAPATIATLWDIGDAGGREVMMKMYQRLHDGDPPSHALRAAQLAVLHTPGSRPADWAGFELAGL